MSKIDQSFTMWDRNPPDALYTHQSLMTTNALQPVNLFKVGFIVAMATGSRRRRPPNLT